MGVSIFWFAAGLGLGLLRKWYRPIIMNYLHGLKPEINSSFDAEVDSALKAFEESDFKALKASGKNLARPSDWRGYVSLYADIVLYLLELAFYLVVLRWIVADRVAFIIGAVIGVLALNTGWSLISRRLKQ